MTQKEVTDNITFLSAMEILRQIVERGLLTEKEAEETKMELKRRLRPTLLNA